MFHPDTFGAVRDMISLYGYHRGISHLDALPHPIDVKVLYLEITTVGDDDL